MGLRYEKRLKAKLEKLRTENERLKKFARQIIEQECWRGWRLDGGEIQELAEKLGLIVPHIVTKEDVEFDDYEVGDTIYKFSETLTQGQGNGS